VVPYLSEPAVRDTAAQVAHGCHPSSVLVFDYLGKRFVEGASGGNGRARDRVTHDYVASLGEPIRFGTNDPLPLLYDAGFRYVRTIAFDQACLSLTGTYDRAREFRFQHLAVASRESLFPI
jgi:O-methyltransferase involved in polyketide biosynthesis